MNEMIMNMLKYGLEGLAVAVAAYYIPKREVRLQEVLMIALTAAVTFMLLDTLAPEIGIGARSGAGFGIGASAVGYKGPAMGAEGMCGGKSDKEGMCGAVHHHNNNNNNNGDKSDKQQAAEGLSEKMNY